MITWEQEKQRVAVVGKIFDIDHQGTEMEILQDEGVHRHVRFARPGTGMYSFNLVTWPGHLAVSGDVETFVFSREHDMFGFFGGNRRRINPGYWAEKVQAGRDNLTSYDEESARRQVLEYFTDAVKNGGVPRGLGRAIREYILTDKEFAYEESAHRLLREFTYGTRYSAWCNERMCFQHCSCESEAAAKQWVKDHTRVHPMSVGDVMEVPAFEFSDSWEWDLTTWDHHFLYACHAITWGIGMYRARKNMPPRLWAKYGRA
jgi:hypothetical protein